MSDYQIVVLDIGKTNKKLLVFDEHLNCLNPDEKGVQFPQVQIDGLLCDDMASIRNWMMGGLAEAAAEYPHIRAISISTHGATIALLGEGEGRLFPGDGGLVFPIVSYEHDAGLDHEARFFADVGMTPKEAQERTATARFGWFINAGKQLHFLREQTPDRFKKVNAILMFSQYLGYLLTGHRGAEPTQLGCHTYLLSADGQSPSAIADALGVADRLPALPPSNTWDALGSISPEVASATGLPPDCAVTMGVHDSNAALVPYFAKGLREFAVQDSGTWIVTMAPCREARFAEEEIGKEVFFNRSIYGDPVKTTIFRGGAEFEFYSENVLKGHCRPDGVEVPVLAEIVRGREAFALPTIARGSGLFPGSVSSIAGLDTVFADSTHAWHTVDLGLAVQGYLAIVMAAGRDVKNVFIEGNVGRHNPVFRTVVSSLLPEAQVRYGSMGGAPFGAALLGVAVAEGVRPEALGDRFEMDLTLVAKSDVPFDDLRKYVDAFLSHVQPM